MTGTFSRRLENVSSVTRSGSRTSCIGRGVPGTEDRLGPFVVVGYSYGGIGENCTGSWFGSLPGCSVGSNMSPTSSVIIEGLL